MRKKISLRVLAFLVGAVVVAVSINPYWRQWLLGPTYQGVPLCAWQEQIRRQTLGEDESRWLAKVRKWIEPKADKSLSEKLTRSERIGIWLTLLDNPVPALRVRAIQALWGSRGRINVNGYFSGSYLSSDLLSVSTVTYYRSGAIQLWDNSSTVWSGSTILFDVDASWSTLAIHHLQVSPPPPAAPHLLRMLDDAEAEVRQAAFTALQGLGDEAAPALPLLVDLLAHADPVRRAQAVRTLNAVHPKTRPWLERLIAALEDAAADVRRAAVGCLADWSDRRMAVAAGPALVKRLGDADPAVRIPAATTLNGLQIHRAAAADSLVRDLRHPDAPVRRRALAALFDAAGAVAYPQLLHCAQFDPDHQVRCAAVAHLGYGGERAVPVLMAFLKDSNAELRDAALGALRNLGSKARLAVPLLLADLDSLGGNGIQALADIGDPVVTPKLIELLEHGDWRNHALQALQALGPAARGAVPRLLELLKESSNSDQRILQTLQSIEGDRDDVFSILERRALADVAAGHTEWAWPLARSGWRAQRLLPALLQTFTKELDSSARTAYVQMLGTLGAQARAAAPALVRLGRDSDGGLRDAVIAALGDLAAAEKLAVPFLLEQLEPGRDAGPILRALAQFGPRAQAARPHVRNLLQSYKSDERCAAIWTVAAIEAKTDAIGQLTPLLRDRDESVRSAAAQALVSLGPPADVLRRLCLLLREDEEGVRRTVAGALGELGLPAASATPLLCELLADDSQSLADAALEALARIEP